MKKFLSLIMAGALLLSLWGCSAPGFPKTDEPFRWTLSPEQIGFYHSPEQCMEFLKRGVQDPFQSAEVGPDGSLTLTMTEAQRQAILHYFGREIDNILAEHNDGTKIRAEVTGDYRELHCYMLMAEDFMTSTREFPVMAYLFSAGYIKAFSDFCPKDYGEFAMYVHNADTEKIVDTMSFTTVSGELEVDEWKWADSYVLTAEEAEAYLQGKEGRDRILFETLTPAIEDSYVLLTGALPRMIRRDYSYFYLDGDYRFHLGLTDQQAESAAESLEDYLRRMAGDLEGRGGALEIAPDWGSCRITFSEGETFGLNYYTVVTAGCLLMQSLKNPEKQPFVRTEIYENSVLLGTADTETGIPQGLLPEKLVSQTDR